jgi:UDP:flavonoid glycosyltransferase YjiC (YdhE family)
LRDKDYKVIITTGKQFDISELGEVPENFFVIPLYPGKEICKQASLMINHGGSGSLNQAVQNRLPQISIPTTAEQQWNSDLIVREGLGKQIFIGDLSAESLNAAVEELLPKIQ